MKRSAVHEVDRTGSFARIGAVRVAFVFAVVLLSVPARAHLGLTDPPARYGPEILKDAPCGMAGGTRTPFVVRAEAGSVLEVRFEEYVDHPGHYRVAFDDDGDDDFVDPTCVEHCESRDDPEDPVFAPDDTGTVLMDFIPDGDREVTLRVPLPDVVCDNCTLQVIQVMYDKRPITVGGNDIYYQCIDLELYAPPGETEDAGPGVDAGAVDAGRDAGRDAGTDAAFGADAGTVGGGGGCATASGAAGVWWWAVWVARRRERH